MGKMMDMRVWIPMHTTYIPINNLFPADTRHQRDITESVSKNHNQTRQYLANVFPTG
jgi:hypothetical protein